MAIATSLTAPCPPVPVLSPTSQSLGSFARKRSWPVSQSRNHCNRRSRDVEDRRFPHRTLFIKVAIARGEVVSRRSPDSLSLSVGSFLSRRVIASPHDRANSVTTDGPPNLESSKLAAVLSLTTIAARVKSLTVMKPFAACLLVTGAYARRSACPYKTWSPSDNKFRSICARTVAASTHLNVEHIAKRSSGLCANTLPLPVSKAKTPTRPPTLASISAMEAGSPSKLAADKAGIVAIVDAMAIKKSLLVQDGLFIR